MACLIIKKGPYKGSVFQLTEGKFLIGRDPSNQISLNDTAASRKHAELKIKGKNITITDLDSRNGTFVNGEPIKERKVTFRDEIRIGNTTLFLAEKDKREEVKIVPSRKVNIKNAIKASIAREDTKLIDTIFAFSNVEMLKKMHSNLAVLYKIGNAINSIRDQSVLLNKIMDYIVETLKVDRGFIMLIDELTEELKTKVVYKAREGVECEEITISRSIIDKVLTDRMSVLISENSKTEVLKGEEDAHKSSIRSAICAPLKTKGKILGIIYIDTLKSSTTDEDYTDGDLMFLTAIANQAAIAIENAMLYEEMSMENTSLREELKLKHDIVGNSSKMLQLFDLIKRVTPTDASLLLRGESGTGKELVARTIHYSGARSSKPFIYINCAVLPETLLESELFGHEKGAFTDAKTTKAGRFEQANGGTVFLDEIGEIKPSTQIKLLRFLQEKEFERVGGTETIRLNVRVIAATNKNLEKAIEDGVFREDLYYRLKVVQIQIPPMREKKEDIPLLARHFLRIFSREAGVKAPVISQEALALMMAYDWPGNVRELKNTMERTIVLGTREKIMPEDLPFEIQEKSHLIAKTPAVTDLPLKEAHAQFEREYIKTLLRKVNGNVSKASYLAKVGRPYFHEKIKKHDITPAEFRT